MKGMGKGRLRVSNGQGGVYDDNSTTLPTKRQKKCFFFDEYDNLGVDCDFGQ